MAAKKSQVVQVQNGKESFKLEGGEARKFYQLMTAGARSRAFESVHGQLQPYARVAAELPEASITLQQFSQEEGQDPELTHHFESNMATLGAILESNRGDESMVQKARQGVRVLQAPTRGRGSSLSVDSMLDSLIG